ncbi:MAG: hypothetical protein LBF86_08550 [Helicobacteraceae bacterium]|jgi:hypothetical protein|nr:hypothetical protein [Helicobacteraceae bacterium]
MRTFQFRFAFSCVAGACLSLSLVFAGCYGGGGDPSVNYAEVAFYDSELTLLEKDDFRKRTTIDLSVYSDKYGVSAWYESGKIAAAATRYSIDGDVNLYAEKNVTEITDENGLKKIGDACANQYILRNDIALTSQWTPICSYGYPPNTFAGVLNGEGHSITELSVDGDGVANAGLFGAIAINGIVKNLKLKTANGKEINGTQSVGAIAGTSGGLIDNVLFEGNISGYGSATGGIVGQNDGVISRSQFEGNVSGGDYVGGIAGKGAGKISGSRFEGNVSGGSYVGGIAGCLDGDINGSYSEGDVSGNNYVGGIVGYLYGADVRNAYSAASVSGGSYVGGIAGAVHNNGGDAEINNSYSIGNISAEGNFSGGIVGRTEISSSNHGYIWIANNYSEGNISGDHNVSGIVGGTAPSWAKILNNAAINEKITANGDANHTVGHVGTAPPEVKNNFALSGMIITGASNNGAEGNLTTQASFEANTTYQNAINGDGGGGLGWRFGNDDSAPWVWGAFGGYKYPTLYWQTEPPTR